MAINVLASSFETFSWPLIIQGLKLNPGPLFAGVANAPNRDELFAQALTLMQGSNSKRVGAFIREFYDDANPYTERLAKIQCPTLIVTAELDHIFTKTSRTLAEHIPNNRVSHHPTCGHMTAIEDPRWLSDQILEFLNWLTKTES
jgi:pimeloyl-ACP methyl ester carboxylesterase